jgi:hypothetical protein
VDSLESIQWLLVIFFLINLIQLGGTLILWRDVTHLQTHPRHRSSFTAHYQAVASEDVAVAGSSHPRQNGLSDSALLSGSEEDDGVPDSSTRRVSDGAKLAGHLRNDGSWAHRSKPLLLPPNVSQPNYRSSSSTFPRRTRDRSHPGLVRSTAQRRRGKVYMILFFAAILVTWVLFMTTAIIKLKGPNRP